MSRLSPDTTDKLLNGTFDLPGKLKFTSNPGTPNNRWESFLSIKIVIAPNFTGHPNHVIDIFDESLLARTPLGSLASGSIFKTPNSGADLFAEESDIEATPRAKSPVPRIQVSFSEHFPKNNET